MYTLKPWFVHRLRRIEDALVRRRVSADALTGAAVAVSVVIGALIACGGVLDLPWLWLGVAPLVVVRLGLNALDGSVARRTHTARTFGAALNEIGDRVSDAAMIGALGFVVPPALALGATSTAFAASSTGVLALALVGCRDCAGPMGKADRAMVVGVAAAVAAVSASTTPFVVATVVIFVGSLLTIGARLRRLRAALSARAAVVSVETLYALPEPAVIEQEMLYAIGR